jgi:hypothetical protein
MPLKPISLRIFIIHTASQPVAVIAIYLALYVNMLIVGYSFDNHNIGLFAIINTMPVVD